MIKLQFCKIRKLYLWEKEVYLSSSQTTGYDLKVPCWKKVRQFFGLEDLKTLIMSSPFSLNIHVNVPEEPWIAAILMRMFFTKSSLYLLHTSSWQLRINSKCKHLCPKKTVGAQLKSLSSAQFWFGKGCWELGYCLGFFWGWFFFFLIWFIFICLLNFF